MDLNKKIMRYGLICVFVLFILNVGLVVWSTLEEPIFLKMYVEKEINSYSNVNWMDSIEFTYITNRSDKRKVSNISFEEAPEVKVDVLRQSNSGLSYFNIGSVSGDNIEMCGQYAVHSPEIQIYLDEDHEEGFNEIELNRARVIFDDGSSIRIDLGSLILYRDHKRTDHIGFTSSSSSSDGKASYSGNVKENIKLLEVKSKLLERQLDYFDLYIGELDYKEISQINYKKGQTLTTRSQTREPANLEDKYTYYDIKPKLYFEDESGEIFYRRIHNIDYKTKSYSIRELIMYLMARGAI